MRYTAWIPAVALTALLGGCGGDADRTTSSDEGASSKAETGKKTFRFALGADPPDLDPSHAADIASMNVLRNTFEPLLRMADDGSVMPGAADTWEHDGTYTTWTFHLNPDAKWSNGDPLVAGDFVYAVERILTPETGAAMGMMVYTFLKGGQEYFTGSERNADLLGIEAIDDHTLEITLENPTHYFPSLLSHPAWYPLHRATVEAHDDWNTRPETFVVNGPFVPERIEPKSRLIAKRNPFYHSPDEIFWEKVEFHYIEETPTELAAYEAGDIDLTNTVPNREALELMKRPDFMSSPLLCVYFVTFNTTSGPFADPALRKAFSRSINRKLIAERIVRRGELPSTGYIPRGMLLEDGRDYRDAAPALLHPEDYEGEVAEAKRILAEAGYGSGKSVPRIEYIVNTDPVHLDIGQTLQNFWNTNLGATVDIQNVEWGELLKAIRSHDFVCARSSWVGDYLDPLTFLEIFETGHEKNGAGYSSEKYDGLLAKIRTESDPDKRLEYIVEAERLIVVEDCIIAPIYEYNSPVLLRPDTRSIIQTPLAGVDVTRGWRE